MNDENDYTVDHQEDIDHIKQMICNLELIFLVFVINTQIISLLEESSEVSETEVTQRIGNIIQSELTSNNWYDNIEEMHEKARDIEADLLYFKSQHIIEFLNGAKFIWVPAVHWTLNTFYKVVKMIDVNLKYLSQYPEESNFKMIFILSSYLSKIFDLMYSASLDDKNDILYNRDNDNDIDLLLTHLNFSEPKDLVEHRK